MIRHSKWRAYVNAPIGEKLHPPEFSSRSAQCRRLVVRMTKDVKEYRAAQVAANRAAHRVQTQTAPGECWKMPLRWLFSSGHPTRAWSVTRAAAYGIGALAALFKIVGPLREAGSGQADLLEIAAAALAFALLCAAAAALHNSIARRLI